jgi:hypothetical protein
MVRGRFSDLFNVFKESKEKLYIYFFHNKAARMVKTISTRAESTLLI